MVGEPSWSPVPACQRKGRSLWFGNSELYPPQKERSSRTMRDALYPFECRQAKISYDGKFLLDVCFQYGDGAVIREKFHFGQFPIMLKSKHCHLRDADPKKLVSYKEESSEMGGYFILNGLERVVRLLILQKQNYPMSMVRNSFRDRKEGYTDKAVVIRCVREDQSGVTVKLYYLSNGSARLGFWAQGKEYMLPVGVVLKALADTTDHEIYVSLTCCYNEKYERVKGSVGTQLVGERVKIILVELPIFFQSIWRMASKCSRMINRASISSFKCAIKSNIQTASKASIDRSSTKSTSSPLCRFSLSRSPSELGSVQSLLPLHSAVAAARMTSCLSPASRSGRALSQELGLSVPR